jgi:hypothetical protein
MDLLIRLRVGPPEGATYQRPRPCRPLGLGASAADLIQLSGARAVSIKSRLNADFWAPSPARLDGRPGAARCQLLGFRAATGDTTQLAPRATQRAGTSIVSEG